MPLGFGTAEWAAALRESVNASSEYRNAASSWGVGFNGNILFAFESGGALEKSLHLLLRLEGGRCLGAEFVPGPTHPEAGFTLRAPFPLWREILTGKTLAATAILTGKMKVEGNTIALLKHAGAHRSLIHCVGSLETRFPGE
ncbi:MAG TPA: SCP2 sterol-binding domain-containing protein [Candidatus Limnocylindrales bacterium]|nr:SCP2 sterol-binding domain-containing protein [Candidatus Limnocylindrales bacterium]